MSRYSTWIEIDVARARENLAAIKECMPASVQVMAIVKANAYGHGGKEIARFLEDEVAAFGVANVNEVLELREAGIRKPVLILGLCTPAEYAVAIKQEATISISSFEMAETVNGLARDQRERASVHIKVDTGMGRLGIPYRSAYETIQRIMSLPHLAVDGIFTHFSMADDENEFTDKQADLFCLLLDELKKKEIAFPCIHCANSAAIVRDCVQEHVTMVRPGLTLYGYHVSTASRAQLSLKPVLSLKSKVLFIKTIESGKGVSYGRKHVTNTPTRVAVLPAGYSHGLPYVLSHRMHVLCKGKEYPVVGSICMDYTMVDIGASNDVVLGDEMVFIGASGPAVITAEDWAAKQGTIPYEVLTRLNPKIPRLYFNG